MFIQNKTSVYNKAVSQRSPKGIWGNKETGDRHLAKRLTRTIRDVFDKACAFPSLTYALIKLHNAFHTYESTPAAVYL